MRPKTQDEIAQEKALKSRPDLIPATAIYQCGKTFAYGAAKHGLGGSGRGTYRDHGTNQARTDTHYASLCRHLNAWARGEVVDESGTLHLACAMAQVAILIDLETNPTEPGSETSGSCI